MTQQHITFGKWVRQNRIEQGLTLQALAGRRMGLEPATISRSENEQSQVTMLTAVRLCKALGLSTDDVISTFIGPDRGNDSTPHKDTTKVLHLVSLSPIAQQENFIFRENSQPVLKAVNVKEFVVFYQQDNEMGNKFLLQLMNRIVEVNNIYVDEMKQHWGETHVLQQDIYPSKPYSLAEVERLVRKSRISRGELYYPELSAESINLIYAQEGALIPEDARRLTEIALTGMESNPTMPHERRHQRDTILQRLKHTSVERTKLDDVIELDILTNRRGELLRMYWQAALIIDEIQYRQNDRTHPHSWPSDWQADEFSLATVYILIGRWLYFVGLGETAFIKR